jgi:hypothetical protein
VIFCFWSLFEGLLPSARLLPRWLLPGLWHWSWALFVRVAGGAWLVLPRFQGAKFIYDQYLHSLVRDLEKTPALAREKLGPLVESLRSPAAKRAATTPSGRFRPEGQAPVTDAQAQVKEAVQSLQGALTGVLDKVRGGRDVVLSNST